MSPAQAKRTVIFSTGTAVGLAALSDLRETGAPRIRIAVGGLLVAVVLTSLSEAAPTLAGSFALLVLMTTLFTLGADTIRSLGSAATGGGE